MSSKSVGLAFVLAFLLVTVVTLAFPSLPPSQAIYESLEFSETSATVFGIPFTSFLIGITNGFLWVLVLSALYGFATYASRDDPLPPLPEANYSRRPPPEPLLVDQFRSIIPPAVTVKIPNANYEIETIGGISHLQSAMLRNLDINTVDDLLMAGSTQNDRVRLGKKIGVTEKTISSWISRGDLLRVKGIGKQYSELLDMAGVESVTDLSNRNPRILQQALRIVNAQKKLVKRVPPVSKILFWVNEAKNLDSLIDYRRLRKTGLTF